MFKILVVGYKLVPIGYFMDEMQEYELHDIYEAMDYANLADWQQTRWIVYAIAQSNSRKKIKPEDLMSLPTDKDYKQVHDKEISNDDIQSLKAMANEVAKYI